MTITIIVTKAKLALAVLAAAVLVPATAMASSVFGDVDDAKYYAEPVEWAYENDITTGKAPGVFAPGDAVTRGETVTFLKRYNDNVVEPLVEAADQDLQDQITATETALAETEAALSAHATHATFHHVIVGPTGVLQSTYPGASAIEFATGIYHLDLPGLEVYDLVEEKLNCALHTNNLGDGALMTGAVLSDDAPLDEFQVALWAQDSDGTFTDGAISLLISCFPPDAT